MKRKIKIPTYVIVSTILICLGLVFIFSPIPILSPIVFTITGLIIILIGIYKLTFSDKQKMGEREYYLDIIEGTFNLIVGVIFINFNESVYIDCGLFIIFLIIPGIRIILSNYKLNQVIIDLPKYFLAICILCSIPKINRYFFYIIGGTIISLTTYYLIKKIIYVKEQKKANGRVIDNGEED